MPKNNAALAGAVKDWIEAHGLTQTTIAARGGPSTSTLTKVLSGEGSFRGVIFAQLDRGLAWGDGVAERHWLGQGASPELKGWREASDDELLAELHRRMESRREIAEWMERYRPEGFSEQAFEELVAAQVRYHTEGGGNGVPSQSRQADADPAPKVDVHRPDQDVVVDLGDRRPTEDMPDFDQLAADAQEQRPEMERNTDLQHQAEAGQENQD